MCVVSECLVVCCYDEYIKKNKDRQQTHTNETHTHTHTHMIYYGELLYYLYDFLMHACEHHHFLNNLLNIIIIMTIMLIL
jgi:hypothetical protein